MLIQPKPLLRLFYPGSLWNVKTKEKVIYLTFDDGPIPGLTEWVLDKLSEYNAKATFFCVGENILRNKDIFERVKREGHLVANHTIHHVKGFKTPDQEYLTEAEECRKLVGNDLFRPPYGQLKLSQYKALRLAGFKVVFWDVISYDYEKISGGQCLRNVLSNTRPGSVVLFHDNVKAEKNLRYSLPLFLKHFANLHFQFKALEI